MLLHQIFFQLTILLQYKNCRGVQKLFTKCENEIKQMLNDLGKNFDKKNPFIVIEGLDASGEDYFVI